jgi:hypothetical protein
MHACKFTCSAHPSVTDFNNLKITLLNGIILEKLIIEQVVKKFPTFCRIQRIITVLARTRHWTLSEARCMQ